MTFIETQATPTQATPGQAFRATAWSPTSVSASRLLIIDDEEINLLITRKYLQDAGFTDVHLLVDPQLAQQQIEQLCPDVVLLDINMPGVSGLDILAWIRSSDRHSRVPVLILTSNTDAETRRQALERGATDFIAKPLDVNELVPRLRNSAAVRQYQRQLQAYVDTLEQEVKRRTEEIALTRLEVVHCLARAAEFRDNETGKHSQRVGRYASIVAEALGCETRYVELIELAAPLHDVGKIGIPDEVLLKRGKLSEDEMDIMRKHAAWGGKVFEQASQDQITRLREHSRIGGDIFGDPQFELLKLAKVIALTHHERFDGTGYPLGLAGKDIPLAGRIVAVADVFDALSTKRPYKAAFPRERCFEILNEGRGTHFDPDVLDAFFSRAEQIVAAQIDLADLD